MNYTPEQCRQLASAIQNHKAWNADAVCDVLTAHAAALERIERLEKDCDAADLIKQLYGHAEALDAATIDPMTIEEVRAREAYHKWRDEQ